MLAYTRFEIQRIVRNARFLVITTIMPALIYLLFQQTQRGLGPT